MQIVPAQCGIARLGGCYDQSTNAVTCNFNSTFCEATCLERNEDGRSCKQWGPRPTWKKPSELRMGQYGDCVCQTTHVGSCYTVQTDHKATCHLISAGITGSILLYSSSTPALVLLGTTAHLEQDAKKLCWCAAAAHGGASLLPHLRRDMAGARCKRLRATAAEPAADQTHSRAPGPGTLCRQSLTS